MTEILKTIGLLSALGSVMVVLMLIIKLFLHKHITGKVQLLLWIMVALSFVIPVWKFIPTTVHEIIEEPVVILPQYFTSEQDESVEEATMVEFGGYDNTVNKSLSNQNNEPAKKEIDIKALAIGVWVFGVLVFILSTMISYMVFLAKKRKNSVSIEENTVFEKVKHDLNIKRKIRVRKCEDTESPFLTGVLFPVIYVPKSFSDEEEEKLVYHHELMHYIHKDLIIKWCVFFVNAIHWFNPLVYLLTKNIGEACEIFCDTSVTKNMGDDEKKKYMNTILNLVSKKG